MDRLLRDVPGRIRLDITGADSAPSVRVFDSAGVEKPGGPFVSVPAGAGFEATLPASILGTLDVLDCSWSVTVAAVVQPRKTQVEVVGGFLCSVAEIRASDPVLADVAKYPDLAVEAAREAAEERLERLCAVAFRPRGRRVNLSGDGTGTLLLPDVEPLRLVSASVTSWAGQTPIPFGAEDLADVGLYDWGALLRRARGVWARGAGNVALLYEHGLPAPPEPVRRAAVTLARVALIRSPIPERATAESSEAGTIRFSIAGRDGWTGYPEVDAVIDQFGRAIPATG